MNEIKIKKAKDLKEGDELIKQKHGGWIVDSINVINDEIQITIKYGSSAYLGLRLNKNGEVKVITKEEKEN